MMHLLSRVLIPAPNDIYTDHTLRNTLWHIHGLLLTIAFLLLFPAGIIAIRSHSQQAFRYHYLLQVSGSILALTGIVVGVLVSKGISLWHQYLGLLLGFMLLVQPLAGWVHHLQYTRGSLRGGNSLFGLIHVWTGRLGMGIAWVNILLGLILRKYNFLVQAGAGVLILCELVLWGLWGLGILDDQTVVRNSKRESREDREGLMTGVGNEFALDDFDDDEDDDEQHQDEPPKARV